MAYVSAQILAISITALATVVTIPASPAQRLDSTTTVSPVIPLPIVSLLQPAVLVPVLLATSIPMQLFAAKSAAMEWQGQMRATTATQYQEMVALAPAPLSRISPVKKT